MASLITLTEICEDKNVTQPYITYFLQEVVINPDQIVLLRSDEAIAPKLNKVGWPEDLDKRMRFTRVFVNAGASHAASVLTIVGSIDVIRKKLTKL